MEGIVLGPTKCVNDKWAGTYKYVAKIKGRWKRELKSNFLAYPNTGLESWILLLLSLRGLLMTEVLLCK